ncbi:MAG: hypothetical protein JXR77_17805 [Lentisphaeria bacterium]|nr:hypothetical protein [Lentisphaeria bacterium]
MNRALHQHPAARIPAAGPRRYARSVAAALLGVSLAAGRELPSPEIAGGPRLALNSSATAAAVWPEGGDDVLSLRLRSALVMDWPDLHLELAGDLHGVHGDPMGLAGVGFAGMGAAGAGYRLWDGTEEMGEETAEALWSVALDRAWMEFHLGQGRRLRIGRQAVGLGRGVLFSAVDVFAPFSALDVDREWRVGVDALRLEWPLGDLWSAEVLALGAESWHGSAFLGRLRGYWDRYDAEILAGRRGRDTMLALVGSAAVAGAEVHAEAAFYDTDGGGRGWLATPEGWVTQTLLGASYTFAVGNGLTLLAEHHFNGFGEEDVAQAWALLALRPSYRERLQRGDMRVLGRHGIAVQATYAFSVNGEGAVRWVLNAEDGSGAVTPFLAWQVGQRTSVLLSLAIPHGPGAGRFGVPRSEYGDVPLTAMAQVRVYD